MKLRTKLSPWLLALLTAAFIVAANNRVFLHALYEQLSLDTLCGVAYLALIVWLMVGVLFALFLLLGAGPLLKPLLALFLLVSAVLGYFTNELGVVFDLDMIHNLTETLADRNGMEAGELISWSLIRHVVVFGIVPAAIMFLLPLQRQSLAKGFRCRATALVMTVLLVVGLALPNYKFVSYFSVEHRDLRVQATPVFSLISLARYFKRHNAAQPVGLRRLGSDALGRVDSGRPRIGVLVVGETARADHFSLGGYARQTNPRLAKERDLLYLEIDSCGTSTAISVPCMFSMHGRDDYSQMLAKGETNVLDILATAGVRPIWIDNNSSCKGVCKRIENINLRRDMDRSSPWYSEGGYYDGVLLQVLDRYLDGVKEDLVIVLHTLGSHGPAYSRRYPNTFSAYAPSCERKSPKECSNAEVTNAYDNTIVYTDYILESVITRLRSHADDYESFMLYVSDHGESLGEHGLYLHGLPYLLAPSVQKRVPLILWLSPSMLATRAMPAQSADVTVGHWSHDSISHTLLGLFDVSTGVYDPLQDLLGQQAAGPPQNRQAMAKEIGAPAI